MKKILEFGKIDFYLKGVKNCLVTIELELKKDKYERWVFSASGNVWDSGKWDILWGGRCIDEIWDEYKPQLKNKKLYKELMGLWQRNHLNGMNAGTPKQEAALAKWRKSDYTQRCEYLESIGLLFDDLGKQKYKYGSGWLYRKIKKKDLIRIKEIIGKT